MKEHEIEVENKEGVKFIVSKAYYQNNKGTLTPVDKEKMVKKPLKNKSA